MLRSGCRLIAIASLAACGCGDPRVSVSFEIPAAYRERVDAVVLELLVPPVGAPFDCDAVAFQDVDPVALAASLVQSVRGARGESVELPNLPREEPKLFYLRGLAADGAAVVAACGALGEVTEDASVALVGEPVVTATPPPLGYGQPLPERLEVAVTDIDGAPVAGVEVRFAVTGPGDFDSAGSEVSDGEGLAVLLPSSSDLPGPSALDVQARWQRTAADGVIGFRDPPVLFAGSLPGDPEQVSTVGRTDYLYQVGRIGPAGEMGFAGLGPAADGETGRRVAIAYYDPTAAPQPFRAAVTAPIQGVFTLGLVRGEGGRQRVIALNGASWIEIQPDGGLLALATPAPGRSAVRIVAGGGCPGAGDEQILVGFTDDSVAAFDADRAPIDHPLARAATSPRLHASGCVDEAGGASHRTVVLVREGLAQDLLVRDGEEGVRRGVWDTYAAGIGFAPALGASPGLLLGPRISVEGTAIGRYQLVQVGDDAVELALVDQDDAPTLLWSAPGGDFDGDGRVDVAALLDFGSSDGVTEFRLLVALGREHRGQRVVGLSPPATAVAPRLLVADFDQNGADDLLIATPTAVEIRAMGEVE